MKVAVVVGQFPALSETFILNHVTGLLDRGIDVGIFAVDRRPQPAMHPDVADYGLLDRTRYAGSIPDSTLRRRLGVARLVFSSAARAPFNGVSLGTVLDYGREDASAALRFRDLPRSEAGEFDIIHCHFGPHGQLGLALRTTGLLGGKLVTAFHGYDMSRWINEAGPAVYDRLFREGDLFLPISDHWRRTLIDMGCPPDKTVVHRMGVRGSAFSFAPRDTPSDGPVQLLTVARLTEKKGVEFGIRAVARLRAAGLDVQYQVVGAGPLQPRLERLIEDLGVGDSVRLLGGVDSAAVAALMGRSHVLLAPSVTAADGNQEGLPVVLMEAMATGLPVVSTYHTGIPELVEHGSTGLLVEERDVDGLTTQVRRLIEDPALRGRVTAAARRRVEEDYDLDALNDQLVDIYHELLGRPSPQHRPS